MEILKELIQIVNKQATKNLEIPGKNGQANSKISLLYEGIHDGEWKTDDMAAAALYNADSNHQTYKKLKYRLQQKLIQLLFVVDTANYSVDDLTRIHNQCRIATTAVSLLFYNRARATGIQLAKTTLQTTRKYEFTELSLNLCRTLKYHYGTISGAFREFEEYSTLAKFFLELLRAEILAEDYYQRLVTISIQSGSKRFEGEAIAEQYAEELKIFSVKYSSYRLHRYLHYVNVYRYLIPNDFENLLKATQEAIKYFEMRPNAAPQVLLPFLMWQLMCHTQLKDYKEGEKVAQRCMSLLTEGSINWFSTLEFYTILSFHTRNYMKAYELVAIAKQQPKFKSLNKFGKENWLLFEAYSNFLIKIGKIDIEQSTEDLKPFRLNKFLNEVPTYTSEKHRANIPIIIIQMLFLLQERNYDEVANKVETLNVYCYRYLRKDETFRSNCFIKMLLLLPKAHFHRTAVIRKTDSLLKKLVSIPLESARQSGEIEIIPYERLWQYIIDMLDTKFHYH